MSPRATIVHVITRLELGGAQENTLYTCQHLDRERFRVVLVYGPGGLMDDEARGSERLEIVEVPELVRAIAPRSDSIALKKLTRVFRDLALEHCQLGLRKDRILVHTHSSKAGVLGRLAARRASIPKVVHGIHGFGFHAGQHPLKRALFLNAERVAGRITDAFVSVSERILGEARQLGIVPPGTPSEVIRSGMVLDPLRNGPGRVEARRALGLPEDDEIVVSIANFKPQKDPLTLISAFAELAAARPRARLVYAGDGGLRPQVERAVRQARLVDRVHLLGWRRDIPQLLAAADVVALSSIFEGLPRSAVQAVAARRPFVGTRVDGTPEIIREGRDGYLVAPRDPSALAQALARALDLRPVAEDTEERVQAWDARRMVEAQEDLYERLLIR